MFALLFREDEYSLMQTILFSIIFQEIDAEETIRNEKDNRGNQKPFSRSFSFHLNTRNVLKMTQYIIAVIAIFLSRTHNL